MMPVLSIGDGSTTTRQWPPSRAAELVLLLAPCTMAGAAVATVAVTVAMLAGPNTVTAPARHYHRNHCRHHRCHRRHHCI
jgi:hypothetical protein